MITALSIIAKKWNNANGHQLIVKQNGIYPYNGKLTVKKNEVLIQVTTWISLNIIIPSERSQLQKTIYCMIQFM